MVKQLIAGNWKMFMRRDTAVELASGIAKCAGQQDTADVAVCPPSVYLSDVIETIAGDRVTVGAQNMHWENEGAFTGEVAPAMLADIGCTWVIIGHSERRGYFGETDETVNKKIEAALEAGLSPIFCLGETLEQREANETENVVSTQLRKGLAGLEAEQMHGFTIAYEPVWAIGTGRTATPEQAEAVHALLRGIIESESAITEEHGVRILYGGSVKPENAQAILSQPNVDGALVGGASLKVDSFSDIISAARKPGNTA